MIEFNPKERTLTCPYCNKEQVTTSSNSEDVEVALFKHEHSSSRKACGYDAGDFTIYHIQCSNLKCEKMVVIAISKFLSNGKKTQIDLLPQSTYKNYPEYIPKAIRDDYVEGKSIIQLSPNAAATMFRRCLQGMIRNFWGVTKPTLYAEIDEIKNKIPASQWKAIDALREMGNIGAHMQKDVDIIVDIDPDEADKLALLIELLMEQWYIARHDDEELYNSITASAAMKKN